MAQKPQTPPAKEKPLTAAQVRSWTKEADNDSHWLARLRFALKRAEAGAYRPSKELDALLDQFRAILRLREIVSPGDTLHTVLRHVSSSGMMRHIDVYSIAGGEKQYLSGYIAHLVGYARTNDGAIKAGGCGMDMGFSIVYNASSMIFPLGFPCIGQRTEKKRGCPANDHANGDRDYAAHTHKDGGYAISQAWL